MIFAYLILALAAGILIELIFQLLRFVDDTEKSPPIPKYVTYDRYMTVTEFVANGRRRWGRYLFFRLTPPATVLVFLAAVEDRYLRGAGLGISLIVAAAISLLPRDLRLLSGKRYLPFSEKFVHLANIAAVFGVAFIVWLGSVLVDLSVLAPTAQGLADNLWSTLLVVLIVTFYNFVSRTPPTVSYQQQQNKLANYVIDNYRKIESKFSSTIYRASADENCSVALLYAILVYENMNRPALIRGIERILVRLLRLNLTTGIAQVKSKKALSDEESISKAAHILAGSEPIIQKIVKGSFPNDYTSLDHFLLSYNPDPEYVKSVVDIVEVFRIYAPNLFLPSKRQVRTALKLHTVR